MKKLYKNTAFLSAFLIFVGYLNAYIYYNEFEIDITTYLSSGELLLSFLPLTIPLLITFAFISFMIIHLATTPSDALERNRLPTRIKQKDFAKVSWKDLNIAYRIIRQKRLQRYPQYTLFVLLSTCRLIIGIGYHLFFFSFIAILLFALLTPKFPYTINIGIWIFLSALWFLYFEDQKHSSSNKDVLSSISVMVLVGLFIGLVALHNKTKAYKILRGHQDFHVSFLYDTTVFKTDSNLMYVGKTNNYLFLIDLNKKTNKVYELSKISNLEFIQDSLNIR